MSFTVVRYRQCRMRLTHDRSDPAEYENARSGHFEDRRTAMVAEAITTERPSSVVELGGGTGRISARLAAAHPDISFEVVEIDRHLTGYGIETYPLQNLAWAEHLSASATAGIVFSIDVIHHLTDRPATFSEAWPRS